MAVKRAAMTMVSRVDAYQRRHEWAGLPLAVLYKFADDQGTYLAAQITYYGFVAVFPLLRLLLLAVGGVSVILTTVLTALGAAAGSYGASLGGSVRVFVTAAASR